MNAIQFANNYSAQLTALAAAYTDNKAAQAAAGDASKERTESLTQQLKDFATLTHIDDVDTAVSRQGLTFALNALEVPKGSVKACGNHFAGYRAMLNDEVDIDGKSNKDAQDYVASDEVKAKAAAKKLFGKHTQKWTAAQWEGLLIREDVAGRVKIITGAEAEQASEAETAEIREAA